MKKAIALILAVVLSFSLCGCVNCCAEGIEGDSRFNNPNVFPLPEFYKTFQANKVNAVDEYVGKVYKFEAYVKEIEMDHIVACCVPCFVPGFFSVDVPPIYVYVPMEKEVIKRLSINQVINIFGEIDSFEEITETIDGEEQSAISVILTNKNKAEDIIEFVGELYIDGDIIKLLYINGSTTSSYLCTNQSDVATVKGHNPPFQQNQKVIVTGRLFYKHSQNLARVVFEVDYKFDSIQEVKPSPNQ